VVRDEHGRLMRETIAQIASRCPRLIATCYWSGTSAIAIEELHHRDSFDLDLHTQEALVDTRPLLAELELAFPGRLEIVEPPDSRGSGFTAVLRFGANDALTIQVFAGFETVPESALVSSTTAAGLRRVTLARYLADKVQCVVERLEARDLFDISSVMRQRPDLGRVLRRAVASQDAVLLAERLLGWTDDAVAADLRAYPGIDAREAIAMRDRLLELVKQEARS
jgi:hypothetical protein